MIRAAEAGRSKEEPGMRASERGNAEVFVEVMVGWVTAAKTDKYPLRWREE